MHLFCVQYPHLFYHDVVISYKLQWGLEPPPKEASHEVESDYGKKLLKNVMEDVSWFHEELRLIVRSTFKQNT